MGELKTYFKVPPLRSRAYRMWVASLPCISCGRVGRSQAAHSNSPEHGKGKGLKASDANLFPLCASFGLNPGCHVMFDTGLMFTKEERREVTRRWIEQTQAQARAAGRKELP